jgi:hypothetical protein
LATPLALLAHPNQRVSARQILVPLAAYLEAGTQLQQVEALVEVGSARPRLQRRVLVRLQQILVDYLVRQNLLLALVVLQQRLAAPRSEGAQHLERQPVHLGLLQPVH